jgi:hypothetical protein
MAVLLSVMYFKFAPLTAELLFLLCEMQ